MLQMVWVHAEFLLRVTWHLMKRQFSNLFKFKCLPLFSSCYCAQCKEPLTGARVLDEAHAWCPSCRSIVLKSWFQVPSWTIGATIIIYAFFNLRS